MHPACRHFLVNILESYELLTSERILLSRHGGDARDKCTVCSHGGLDGASCYRDHKPPDGCQIRSANHEHISCEPPSQINMLLDPWSLSLRSPLLAASGRSKFVGLHPGLRQRSLGHEATHLLLSISSILHSFCS